MRLRANPGVACLEAAARPDLVQVRTVLSAVLFRDLDHSAAPLSATSASVIAYGPRAPFAHRAVDHTAGLLEVVAAVGELETRVVAVAWLVARALDNRVRRLLLNDAARVPALATELQGAAAAGGGPVNGQGNQRGDDDQPGQPGRVLPPHSPRDSATPTTLLSPPPATTTTLGPWSRR